MFIFNAILFIYISLILFLIYKAVKRKVVNKKYDEELNIETSGYRYMDNKKQYNRTESTPYLALKTLVEEYELTPTSQIVDYGAGKGRVSFFLNHNYNVPVTGIEINKTTFDDAKENLIKYEENSGQNIREVDFKFEYAEEYKLDKADNVFFFFNPFKPEIFSKVVDNIVNHSIKENKEVDVILYYRVKGFEECLEQNSFDLVQTINTAGSISVREKIRIYKFKP